MVTELARIKELTRLTATHLCDQRKKHFSFACLTASGTGVKRPTLARKREQISDLRGKGEEPFPCFDV